MGLSLGTVQLILEEHKHKKLPKRVHTIGRQVIQFGYEEALFIFEKSGIAPLPVDIEYDTETTEAKFNEANGGSKWITDRTLFKMAGVEELASIDISDYENASIIADLTQPLPLEHYESADFIIGGSTLDNVFNPAMYLINMSRLLKPGGRLFEINISVNMFFPYVIFTPFWFLDYFVVNNYSDCKVYMLEIDDAWYAYGMDWEGQTHINNIGMDNFPNREDKQLWTIVLAEKSKHSTNDEQPVQFWYRTDEQWRQYRENLGKMLNNSRKWPEFNTPSQPLLERFPPLEASGYRFLGQIGAS